VTSLILNAARNTDSNTATTVTEALCDNIVDSFDVSFWCCNVLLSIVSTSDLAYGAVLSNEEAARARTCLRNHHGK
jgi:hypothetical protein